MLLRLLIFIGMTIFCIVEAVHTAGDPHTQTHNQFLSNYIAAPVFMLFGFGKVGMVTWPIASLILVAADHYIIGWIPLALVAITVYANRARGVG